MGSAMPRVRMRMLMLVVVVLPSIAFAEPTPVVRHLMEQPVSALEFGLFTLEREFIVPAAVFSSMKSPVFQTAVAEYDWDANRIELNIFLIPDQKELLLAAQTGKALCREALLRVREVAGIGSDGKPRAGDANASKHFRPRSHTNPNAPKNLEQEVLSIIQLDVLVFSKPAGDGSHSYVAKCSAPLLGTDVMFKD